MTKSYLLVLFACTLIVTAFLAGCTDTQQGSPSAAATTMPFSGPVPGSMTTITAEGKTYPAYITVPVTPGNIPG